MSWEAILVWVQIAQILLTGGMGVYVYVVGRGDAIHKKINKNAEVAAIRFTELDRRLSTVEGAIPHLPTHNDMVGIKENIAKLQGETEGQTKLLEALAKSVERMNDWLVKRAK